MDLTIEKMGFTIETLGIIGNCIEESGTLDHPVGFLQRSLPLGRPPGSIGLGWQRQATIQWEDAGQEPTAEVASA